MTYIVATPSGRGRKTGDKRTVRVTVRSPYGEVRESLTHVPTGDRKIEIMLENIITRLDRIEEKIDENVYPPESAIKPEFIKRVKKAQADLAAGKGKTYDSMDDFIRAISE
ncbi:MAG TPA: DUF2683 family protein [Methanoregula sp.]|nr:DUF2683 family protein [Methanoregula sp.]